MVHPIIYFRNLKICCIIPKPDKTTPPINIIVHCRTSVYVTASRPPEKSRKEIQAKVSGSFK